MVRLKLDTFATFRGSDWPQVNMRDRQMPNDGDLFDPLLDWAPDAADQKRILADNPAALYGVPSAGR